MKPSERVIDRREGKVNEMVLILDELHANQEAIMKYLWDNKDQYVYDIFDNILHVEIYPTKDNETFDQFRERLLKKEGT